MILVILEIITFKRHQTDDSRLLRLRGDIVGLEGLGGEFGGLFGGGALALCWGVIAGVGSWSDLEDLGFCEGCIAGDEGEGEGEWEGGC